MEEKVVQDLEKLSRGVALLSDAQLDKLMKDIAILLPGDRRDRRPVPCRYDNLCKKADCRFSHPQREKKASMQHLLTQMRDEANKLKYSQSEYLTAVHPSAPPLTRTPAPETIPLKESNRKEDMANRDKVSDTLHQVRSVLNKVTWSNYDTLLSQLASLVDSLFVTDLLDDSVSAALLTMMTDYTIYVEAYGKMWSTLTEIYPCLLTAEQNILNSYLEYYDHCVGNDKEKSVNRNEDISTCIKKRQRSALTSFLVHSMKYSSVSTEREEITEKINFLVRRLDTLQDKGVCNGEEFTALIDDMLVFLREGWEVLYREEVWPLCIQQIEKTIAFFKHQRTVGGVVPLRLLFALEGLMKDIVEHGRYHNC